MNIKKFNNKWGHGGPKSNTFILLWALSWHVIEKFGFYHNLYKVNDILVFTKFLHLSDFILHYFLSLNFIFYKYKRSYITLSSDEP